MDNGGVHVEYNAARANALWTLKNKYFISKYCTYIFISTQDFDNPAK